MTVILDGRKLSAEIKADVKEKVSRMGFKPGLATVLVGDDPASRMYVDMKRKACDEVGFESFGMVLPEETTQKQLLDIVHKFNNDGGVHGILIQLPLPEQIDTSKILKSIDASKDVDGFNPVNMGFLMSGNEDLVAATPKGIIRLLEEYDIGFEGKEVVIVNHSTVVGKPLAMLFLNRQSTVTVCHVETRHLSAHTRNADILVSATGVPHLIKANMIKEDAVVVDVGISKKEGKTVGDVDFEEVKKKCSHITPVPGGTGPMTIAALLENTYLAASKDKSGS